MAHDELWATSPPLFFGKVGRHPLHLLTLGKPIRQPLYKCAALREHMLRLWPFSQHRKIVAFYKNGTCNMKNPPLCSLRGRVREPQVATAWHRERVAAVGAQCISCFATSDTHAHTMAAMFLSGTSCCSKMRRAHKMLATCPPMVAILRSERRCHMAVPAGVRLRISALSPFSQGFSTLCSGEVRKIRAPWT
jgi:hypothetical protein